MPVKYTVTDVNERRRFTGAGGETLAFDIHIQTERGATGSIRIPVADYEKEKVKELLDALAERLEMPFGLE